VDLDAEKGNKLWMNDLIDPVADLLLMAAGRSWR